MCNQFHQATTNILSGLTSKFFTWDTSDEMRVTQVDGILRYYDPLDIIYIQKRKMSNTVRNSDEFANIVGGYLVVYKF